MGDELYAEQIEAGTYDDRLRLHGNLHHAVQDECSQLAEAKAKWETWQPTAIAINALPENISSDQPIRRPGMSETRPLTVQGARGEVERNLNRAFFGRTDAEAAALWSASIGTIDALITAVRAEAEAEIQRLREALEAVSFLVLAHGSPEQIAQMKRAQERP